jgi:hypothetical protein
VSGLRCQVSRKTKASDLTRAAPNFIRKSKGKAQMAKDKSMGGAYIAFHVCAQPILRSSVGPDAVRKKDFPSLAPLGERGDRVAVGEGVSASPD